MNGITDYHAKYYAHELTKRCPSDSLEKFTSTLMDAQVDLNPHQIDAALFAFKSPLSKGAMLADEVGLGKTIEAGIVLSQKWAERKRKILIICPSSIRKQWNQELLEKFYLPSVILETKSFNDLKKKGKKNPLNTEDAIVICSYQFCKSKAEFIKGINWDLVVLDEAHRLRNVYKTSNKIARAIKDAIFENNKLLLTATPLQNSLLELYGLVSFIDEHAFGDFTSFKSKFSKITSDDQFYELKQRLAPICKRTLRRQVLQYIKYTNRIAIREEFIPNDDEQKLYDLVSNYLQRKNLFALPNSQRQLITLVLRKLLASSTFAIAGALDSIISRLKKTLDTKEPKVDLEEDVSDNLETVSEIAEEWDEDQAEEDAPLNEEDLKAVKEEIVELESFKSLAVSIMNNAKGEKLLDALSAGFNKMNEFGASPKALIFTESRRTQDYLLKLFEETEHKGKVVLFNGSNSDTKSLSIYKAWFEKNKGTDKVTGSKTADMRAALVDYFKNEASIMIATEAAAEGVNLQFCSLLINYDLPWNPQRVEQRIGRCHRYGQKYDVVVINFINKNNAADQRVYQLLEEKFKLFSGVFGASDEVLGAIESGVDFEKKILKIYQDCRSPEQITEAFDELQKELEQEITEEVKRTKKQILEELDEEVQEKLKIQLRDSEDFLNKYEEWLWKVAHYHLIPYADFIPNEARFILKTNPFPKEDICLGEYKLGKPIEHSLNFRMSHPLAQKILETYKTKNLLPSELVFDYTNHPTKISVLEGLVGKSGSLSLDLLTLEAFEVDDYLVCSGISDSGAALTDDEAFRLLSVSGKINKENIAFEKRDQLRKLYQTKKEAILGGLNQKNGKIFDEEMDKLDKWADDKKTSLKVALKDLEDEIKELKKEIKQSSNLPEKIKLQKKKQALDKKYDDSWKEYEAAQKEIEKNKDSLIEKIEKKMNQKIFEGNIFEIRWVVK